MLSITFSDTKSDNCKEITCLLNSSRLTAKKTNSFSSLFQTLRLSIYDTFGNFIDGIRSGTCSHEAKGLGFEGAYRVMKENIETLLYRHNLKVEDIAAAAFGLAGVDVPFQKRALEEIVERIGFTNYVVLNDGFLGIKAASPTGVGVCSINGTGTVNVGIDSIGKYEKGITGDNMNYQSNMNTNNNAKYEELEKVKKLYDEKILTKEEYEKEKERILNQL